MPLATALFLLVIVSFIFVAFNFICFLIKHRLKTRKGLFRIIEIWTMVMVPLIFLSFADFGLQNDCCLDTALFSPGNSTGIYCLLAACTAAYFVSSFRKNILPPVPEVIVNVFLLLGLVINVLLCIHIGGEDFGIIFWFLGNIPIMMLFLITLLKNQQLLKQHIESNDFSPNTTAGKLCLSFLKLQPAYRYPLLTLLILPVLILLSLFLMLFAQKPDGLIRAFTDTYRQGFSQLDYMCNNVNCGGHYLCSVAANGHPRIVKPQRQGIRNGNRIICNRQLLLSNAFEELLQEHVPFLHRRIRNQYNKAGNFIHRYYFVFNNKLIADSIYILMKPAEWFFLLTLYTFDRKPEDRIERQYAGVYREVD